MLNKERLEKFLKEASKSDIFIALLFLVFIDVLFRFGTALHQHQSLELGFDIPYRSRIWWATKDFLLQQKTPDIVLLGASDVVCALYGAEATFLKNPQSQLLKHHSQYLESRLGALNSDLDSNFCLAIPGEMPSDAYLLTSTLLSGKTKPKAIFFAITPRSFFDTTFGDPSSTEIYKLMSKLGGTHNLDISCRSSLWDKLDYLFAQASYIYYHKRELICWQHHLIRSLLAKLLPTDFSVLCTPPQIRKLSQLELPEDFAPQELVEFPYDPQHPVFINNLPEYKARYRQLKASTFTQQFYFFNRLCDLCRTNGVNLIVANSPVTAENRGLIPAQVYSRYLTQMEMTVHNYGGTFENLDMPAFFTHDDFFDSIHLNGRGGEKLLNHIAIALTKTAKLANCLSPK